MFLFYALFSQQTDGCKCDAFKKAKDSVVKTYSNNNYKTSKRKALTPPFKFISVRYLKKFARSEDITDSLKIRIAEAISKVPDSMKYKTENSVTKAEFAKQYGDIPRPLIIKTGKLKDTIAILYQSHFFFNSKYYLRISTDNGKTWKNFYTGLQDNNHYIFKRNSQFPLWKDSNHLQIEADVVRMTSPLTFPGGGPDYETLKNNALITIHLDEILKDSDGDGFNDLEERLELFTNPFSKDTDNDGISDHEDINPKYETIDNDFTKVLQAIIYGDYPCIENPITYERSFFLNLKTFKEDLASQRENNSFYETKKSFLDEIEFKVIISDDKDLRKMDTFGEKVLFLTSKEFSEYIKQNYNNSYKSHYTKIFKCDDKKDTYILEFNGVVRGETYIITKTSEGWNVNIIEHWIA